MTKKDYNIIANVISDELATWEGEANQKGRTALHSLAMGLSRQFEQIDERFDHNIFMTSCGFKQSK